MTTDQSKQPSGDDDCPPPSDTDPNCDPKLIDEVACKGQGVAAQAAYNATYQDQLTEAKASYDTTRKEYRNQRQAASLQVQDLRHQIKHLIERIKCLFEQKKVATCLDDAFKEVVVQLKCCETDAGCCAKECEFAVDDAQTLEYAVLIKRIADYQRQVDEAKACFTTLVGEPAALTQRVADAKAAVDGINAALNADPAITDLKRVYAEALVASRDIERIWGGFDETHEFVDCLCHALTCWTKGCEAVSILTGAKAVAECQDAARKAHCDALRTNTVDEILAAYDRLCPQQECDDSDKSGDCADDNGEGDDCSDSHHHHPHHHHKDEPEQETPQGETSA